MTHRFYERVPVLTDFSRVADNSHYASLPDDWSVGVSDVVNSTAAIADGRYKAVNLAGAGTISAVANALAGDLPLFIFSGDGARFAVPPAHADRASDALSRAAMWAKRDLDLDLRVAMVAVADLRNAGVDVRTALWQASSDVRYAMFIGGGFEWAEAQLKRGEIGLPPAADDAEPDLTGLSCQWGPIETRRGRILSLIVGPARGVAQDRFAAIVEEVIALLDEAPRLNPVPPQGPAARWPSAAIGLQSRVAARGRSVPWRRVQVTLTAVLIWLIFKLGLRIGAFEPARYRREMAANTDFRKFDDSLMLTVDCAPELVERLRALLDRARAEGTIRYGLHTQEKALVTCIAPSVRSSEHMHFVDGADGGYAAAAGQMS